MAATVRPAYRVRPLLLGDVLDEAFRIYRAHFGLLAGTALMASIPGLLIGLGGGAGTLMGSYLQGTLGADSSLSRTGVDGSLLWLIGVGGILAVVAYPVTSALPHFAASATVLGLPVSAGSLLRYALRNYFRLWVLAIVNVLLSLLAVFIAPIYLLVRWSFIYQVFYIERPGVGGSFSRSGVLVEGSWWRVFGIRLLARVLVGVIGLVLGVMAAIPALLLPLGLVRQGATGLFSAIAAALLLPYPALVLTLLYMDQRVRLEALDLQLMAGDAGAAGTPVAVTGPGATALPPAAP